uniref:CUB_2 domain-containing protein n=1 Tax=Caenorhabditis tropicalis TaxID=1561998 RepID=A0A1I7TTS7_9PELO
MVFQKFLSNTVAPICRSRILILLKRLPNENYTSTLIDNLHRNHVSVDVITSTTPSGGLYQKTMYEIATRTNGLCAFESDDHFAQTTNYMNKLDIPYTVYSVNVQVSGSGSISLPTFIPPCTDQYCHVWLEMTVQDHGPMDSYRTANLTWENMPTDSSGYLDNDANSLLYSDGTLLTTLRRFYSRVSYTMALDYQYSNNETQIMQIRIFSDGPIDKWFPYD